MSLSYQNQHLKLLQLIYFNDPLSKPLHSKAIKPSKVWPSHGSTFNASHFLILSKVGQSCTMSLNTTDILICSEELAFSWTFKRYIWHKKIKNRNTRVKNLVRKIMSRYEKVDSLWHHLHSSSWVGCNLSASVLGTTSQLP